MKRALSFLLDLLYPPRCVYCGEVVATGKRICYKCGQKISALTGETCIKCGALVADCNCKGRAHYFDQVLYPFYYEGAYRDAMLRLKNGKNFELVKVLGREMAGLVAQKREEQFDLVTFVPMEEALYKKRGFNQAELLAKAVAEELGVPCEDTLFLAFPIKPQHTLKSEARWGNVAGAYEQWEDVSVEDKKVLLVDDIITTGATLSECADILYQGKANLVVALTGMGTKFQKIC